jgi:hypothetical protein
MRSVHAALRRSLSAFLNCHGCYVLSRFLQQILQSPLNGRRIASELLRRAPHRRSEARRVAARFQRLIARRHAIGNANNNSSSARSRKRDLDPSIGAIKLALRIRGIGRSSSQIRSRCRSHRQRESLHAALTYATCGLASIVLAPGTALTQSRKRKPRVNDAARLRQQRP